MTLNVEIQPNNSLQTDEHYDKNPSMNTGEEANDNNSSVDSNEMNQIYEDV